MILLNRIDRLILQARQQAQQNNNKGRLTMGLLSPGCYLEEPKDSDTYNSWELVAYIEKEPSKLDQVQSFHNTREEALAEWERLELQHPSRGKNEKEAVLMMMKEGA